MKEKVTVGRPNTVGGHDRKTKIAVFVMVFVIVALIAVLIIIVIVDNRNTDALLRVLPGGGDRAPDPQLPEDIGVPAGAEDLDIRGCEWDTAHNLCNGYTQGLKRRGWEDRTAPTLAAVSKWSQNQGFFLGGSQRGYATATNEHLWEPSTLKFIGSTSFIITKEDTPCNVDGVNLTDMDISCDQLYFFGGLNRVVPGYFGIPPHQQIFNKFRISRLKEDAPFYRYMNLIVSPNENCTTQECNSIRAASALSPWYLAYGKLAQGKKAEEGYSDDEEGFYFTTDGSLLDSQWELDFIPLETEPV
jgi:hypothetical protein